MLPAFDSGGNLPPGQHKAAWPEFVQRFGYTERRTKFIAGMAEALRSLRRAGCATVYIDGSFVTDRRDPGDYDGCWDAPGTDMSLLDPVLLDFDSGRRAQKAKYKGELFCADRVASSSGETFKRFFQRDRDGNAKGIVEIDLGDLDDQK